MNYVPPFPASAHLLRAAPFFTHSTLLIHPSLINTIEPHASTPDQLLDWLLRILKIAKKRLMISRYREIAAAISSST